MARALNAPRDPAWTADGIVSDRWLPVSPVSGRLDAFQWRVPVAEVGERATLVIDAPAEREPAAHAGLPRPELPAQELPREVASPPLGNVAAENGGPASSAAHPQPRAAPIIPLAQVP